MASNRKVNCGFNDQDTILKIKEITGRQTADNSVTITAKLFNE